MLETSGNTSINIERRVGAFTLLAAWLVVFVLPVAILQISLDYLFKLTRQANMRALAAKMTNEMDSFRNDLETDNYLQKGLQEFFAENNPLPENDPLKLVENLRCQADLKVAGVVTHSADTQGVDYWFKQNAVTACRICRILLPGAGWRW